MSIITRIKKDHQEIKNFYAEYEKFRDAVAWDDARQWYNQFAWEVARHSASEEVVLYPYMEKHAVGNVAQNRMEHQVVKENLARLETLNVNQQEFHDLMRRLFMALEDHMQTEETIELPALSNVASINRLDSLGKCPFASLLHSRLSFIRFSPSFASHCISSNRRSISTHEEFCSDESSSKRS
jgi:iron-sulfur cluster repair protein YtfE (RIC family)